jgi:hypothetical protein
MGPHDLDTAPGPLSHRPLHLREANAYVDEFHRHHKKVQTHKFSIGAYRDGLIVGVVITGRPASRILEDGVTAEVNRLCTDGSPNVCSYLYAVAARVAREMGYRSILTYILTAEPGTSLKAAGWVNEGIFGGGTWDRPNVGRHRVDKHPLGKKQRWRKILNAR